MTTTEPWLGVMEVLKGCFNQTVDEMGETLLSNMNIDITYRSEE